MLSEYMVENGRVSGEFDRPERMVVVAASPKQALDVAARTSWPNKIDEHWQKLSVWRIGRSSGPMSDIPRVTSVSLAKLDTWVTA